MAWSLAAFGIGAGAAIAARGFHGLDWVNLALTVAGGVFFQGVVAHSTNELIDWKSGTDRYSDGILSGGAKVLRRGVLTQCELELYSWLGGIAAFGVALALGRRVGGWVWLVYIVGCWASLGYSLPPLRLAYRPLAGEWLAAWPATWTCVYAGGLILGAPRTSSLALAASVHATMSVSWLMQHHLADIPADLAAVPQKQTTVAWASMYIGRVNCRYIVAGYFLLTACLALLLCNSLWITVLPAVLAVLGAVAALATDPQSVASITTWQRVMIGLSLVDALVLGSGLAIGIW
ncbi:MAG: prenyltransferase [Bacillota bacterium]